MINIRFFANQNMEFFNGNRRGSSADSSLEWSIVGKTISGMPDEILIINRVETLARLLAMCLIFWIYFDMVWKPVLMDWSLVFNFNNVRSR